MKLKNKNSQIGATISWIAATLVVLFIMLIFIAGTMAIAKVKGFNAGSLFKETSSGKAISLTEADLTKKISDFINKPYDSNLKILNLLVSAGDKAESAEESKKKQEFYAKQRDDFLETEFNKEIYAYTLLNLEKYNEKSGKFEVISEYSTRPGFSFSSVNAEGYKKLRKIELYVFPDKKLILAVMLK